MNIADRAAAAAHIRKPVVAARQPKSSRWPLCTGPTNCRKSVYIGHDVSRAWQAADQRPLEDAPPGKIVHRGEPGRRHTDARHPSPTPMHSRAVLRRYSGSTVSARCDQVSPVPAGEHVGEHRQHRHRYQRGNDQRDTGKVGTGLRQHANARHWT